MGLQRDFTYIAPNAMVWMNGVRKADTEGSPSIFFYQEPSAVRLTGCLGLQEKHTLYGPRRRGHPRGCQLDTCLPVDRLSTDRAIGRPVSYTARASSSSVTALREDQQGTICHVEVTISHKLQAFDIVHPALRVRFPVI